MRLLIVDDEPNICEGLAILSSRALGPHHTVACESDPVRALERLEEEQYDLLVTDISMPEIDGLELTRRARSRGLISHVIIVTGYEEFAYAREALRQGAVDFLLKPIDKEELSSALRRTAEILGSSVTRIPNATLAAQALLPGGARESTPASESPSALTEAPAVAVIVTTMNGGSHVRNLARNVARGVGGSQRTTPGIIVVPADRVDAVAALVPLAGSDGLDASAIRTCRDSMQGHPIGVAVGIPNEDRIEAVSDRAYCALLAASIYGEPVVVWEANSDRGPSAGARRVPVEERDLLSPRTISNAVERIVTSDWSTPLVRTDTCRQLVRLLAVRIAIATGVATAELARETDLLLLAARSSDELLNVVRELVGRTASTMNRSQSAADRILAAIRTATPADLYLQGVADQLGLTPGYVSATLKEKTGKSFAIYANEVRMDLAQQLLLEVRSLTVDQIAQSVGFSSPRQFYRQFKRYVGLTPNEYRNREKGDSPQEG